MRQLKMMVVLFCEAHKRRIYYDPAFFWYLSPYHTDRAKYDTPHGLDWVTSGTPATLHGLEPSVSLNDTSLSAAYLFQRHPAYANIQESAGSDPFTVFKISADGGPGDGKGYIGRKETYSAGIQPSALENELGSAQWSGGGNPSGGSGATFSTRHFSAGAKAIQASLALDGAASADEAELSVKDIFMYADGMIEYNKDDGVYPGNPNFGVYASKLVSGNGWNNSLVNLDGNGDPSTPAGSDLWYNLFQEDLEHKANTLCNCRWMGNPETEPVVLRPAFTGDNADLGTFNWKGHTAPTGGLIDTEVQYRQEWNTGVIKLTATNCHGNSAHSWGVASLYLNPENVKAQLENLGGTVTVHTNQTQSQILSNLAAGDILFFKHSGSVVHSAYVVSNGGTAATLELWANNNGVPDKRAGYDIITLEQDLTHNNHHDTNNFDYYKVVF